VNTSSDGVPKDIVTKEPPRKVNSTIKESTEPKTSTNKNSSEKQSSRPSTTKLKQGEMSLDEKGNKVPIQTNSEHFPHYSSDPKKEKILKKEAKGAHKEKQAATIGNQF
jgi:hypothetical protein